MTMITFVIVKAPTTYVDIEGCSEAAARNFSVPEFLKGQILHQNARTSHLGDEVVARCQAYKLAGPKPNVLGKHPYGS